MSKTKFPKSVSFNTKNEEDKLILKHIARRNFSGYVKKLIIQDIKQKQELKRRSQEPEVKPINKQQPEVPVSPVRQNRNSKQVLKSKTQTGKPLLNIQGTPKP